MKDIIKIINDNLSVLNKNISSTSLWNIGIGCKWEPEVQIVEPLRNSITKRKLEKINFEDLNKYDRTFFDYIFNDLMFCINSDNRSFAHWIVEAINRTLKENITIEDYNYAYQNNKAKLISTLNKIDSINKITKDPFEYFGLKGKCLNDFP